MLFRRFALVILALVMPLMLIGCGESLFGTEEESSDSLSDLLKDADYSAVIELADSIIEDDSSTDYEVSTALIYKGEAQVGQTGFSLIGLIADLAALEEDEDDETLFSMTDFGEGVTTASLGEAVETFNMVSTNVLSDSEENSFELKRGVLNAMLTIEFVQSVYDTETGSFLDQTVSTKDNLAEMVNPGGGLEDIDYYSGESVTALENSEAFDTEDGDSDLTGVEDIDDTATELALLNDAAQSGGIYTDENGDTYDFSGDNASDDAEITAALDVIFGEGSD